MSNPHLQNQRTQTLLLIQKILLKPETSPFTLVLDSVEQGAGGLVEGVVGGAKVSKTHTIYVSQSSLNAPSDIDTQINARRKTPETLKKEILAAVPQNQKTLLILSPLPTSLLHPLINLPTYLLSLLSPSTSLFLIHHLDIPLPYPHSHTPRNKPTPTPSQTPYAPNPLTLLRYIATTILTLSSFPQTLAKQAARNHAKEEPNFGLQEGSEGIIIGKGANAFSMQGGKGGMIIEMEHRRKSGRSVTESFFLPSSPPTPTSTPSSPSSSSPPNTIKNLVLLSDHPLFAPPTPATAQPSGDESIREEDLGGTFNLGLTEKQRRDREGVVLPYYDAQRRRGEEVGSGEGGRILYEMGVEDDFDEEEDEI